MPNHNEQSLAFASPRRAIVIASAWLLALVLFAMQAAHAVNFRVDTVEQARRKIAPDLLQAVEAPQAPLVPWVKQQGDARLVKLLILGKEDEDPKLNSLRRAILDAGGSVYYRYISISGVAAMLPAQRVIEIARRSDVESLSPNRITTRTASLVEQITGADTARLPTGSLANGYDGAGVGIAFLDSGIMSSHRAFVDQWNARRVKRSLDVRLLSAAIAPLWTAGWDVSADFYPGSDIMAKYEAILSAAMVPFQDPYGHGTMVASVAAGRGFAAQLENGGIAPRANIFDLRVLDENGIGEVADALAALDWIVYHAREFNIRVVNVSLTADSTQSYQLDPLCRAVRNAVAAGLTVVVAAGNHGLTADGHERYGSVGSPAIEPSAITVGSANPRATAARADDVLNQFSSRGPTRGARYTEAGVLERDNLLKPDLVAPGNRLVGALATDVAGAQLNKIVRAFPALEMASATGGQGLMSLSGTSLAAPVVSGAAALLLQANPGLTPPLVKAILQYTAEPLAGYSLLQQGTGLVNIAGALQLALSLRSDVNEGLGSAKLRVGDALLAAGKTMPAPYSTFGGQYVPWSRIVILGGRHVLAGEDLFRKFQLPYDPSVSWVGQRTSRTTVYYYKTSGSNHLFVQGFETDPLDGRRVTLVTSGVRDATAMLGASSLLQGTGAFTPVAQIATRVAAGEGATMTQGIVLADGLVLADGITLSEGMTLSEGITISEGITMSEGITVSEGTLISESGVVQSASSDAIMLGEP
jgi:serine protease AprX